MTPPRRASTRPAARGHSATRSCTSAWPASSPAPARCAASTPARTTSRPRSTGRSPAARPARRSSRSRWPRRIKAGYSLKDTFDGNSPYESPTGHGARGRRTEGDNDYGSAVNLIKATEDSINTAFTDLTDVDARRPAERSSTWSTRWASRRTKATEQALRLSRAPAPGLEPIPGITLGSATVSPINMANAYAPSPTAARPRRRTSSRRSSTTGRRGPLRPHRCDKRRASTRTSPPTCRYALQQVVAGGTGTRRPAPRPAGRRQDRHRDQRRRRGRLVVVRRLHPAAGDRGHVRPRQGQRAARRLRSPSYFGGDYPTADVDRDHAARHGGRRRSSSSREPAYVDGEAPEDGHEPTCRRRPTQTPKPPKKPTKKPTTSAAADRRRRRPRPSRRPPTASRRRPPTARRRCLPPSERRPVERAARADARRGAPPASPPTVRDRRVGERWPASPGDRGGGRVRPASHPTLDDPVVAALSEGVGGPLGEHAAPATGGGRRCGCVLALAAVCFALGMVQKAACYDDSWLDGAGPLHATCATPTCPTSTPVAAGRAELALHRRPAGRGPATRSMEYPVGISYFAYGTAWVTHWLTGSPDVDARATARRSATCTATPQVVQRAPRPSSSSTRSCSLGSPLCCPPGSWPGATGAGRGTPPPSRSRRRWLLTGLVNWDLLAVVMVAGALWAWSRDRPVLTGVLIGLGTATKLYPLFLLGAIAGDLPARAALPRPAPATVAAAAVAWVLANAPAYLTGRDAVEGLLDVQLRARPRPRLALAGAQPGRRPRDQPRTPINHWSWVFFGAWCAGGARGRPAGPEHAAAGPARLPGRGRLPAGQQGLLAAVRAVAAAAGGAGPAALARPADLAGRRGRSTSPRSGGTSAATSRPAAAATPASTGSRSSSGWPASSTWSLIVVARRARGPSTTRCRPASRGRPQREPAQAVSDRRGRTSWRCSAPARRPRRRPRAPARRAAGTASRPACAAARRRAAACRRCENGERTKPTASRPPRASGGRAGLERLRRRWAPRGRCRARCRR